MCILTPSRSLLFCLVTSGLIACGGGGDDNAPEITVETYVGTWRTTSGSIDVTCDGEQMSISTAAETMLTERGTDSDLRIPEDEDCPDLSLDFIGTEALLTAPVTCSLTDEEGTYELTLQSYTLAATDAGHASESGQGTASVSIDGTDVSCTFSTSGQLEKL